MRVKIPTELSSHDRDRLRRSQYITPAETKALIAAQSAVPRASSPTPSELKARRLATHLTQADAARLLHVDLRSFQKWEGGERDMHPAFWELFCIKTQEG
jgi:putative transcriptional regulator